MATPIQQKIYLFIQNHIKNEGFSPSLEEIAVGIGISPNSISLVSRHIHALVAVGKLKFYKKGYRNLELVEEKSQSFNLPLVGKIAAGTPIAAIENHQALDLGALLVRDNRFVLEVKGDSMIEAGILDGDFVICETATQANEGEIVVALVDDEEATLKRLSYQIPDRVTLLPANTTLKPKAYLPHRVKIQGIYIGLLRMNK